MGKSAKLHKRVPKKNKSSTFASVSASTSTQQAAAQVQNAKKKAGLKAKSKPNGKQDADMPVLGGADYVDLMVGGRSKAKQEASKLPARDG